MNEFENPEKSGTRIKNPVRKLGACFRLDVKIIHASICNETLDIEVNGKKYESKKKWVFCYSVQCQT